MNIRLVCLAVLGLCSGVFAQGPKPGTVGFKGKSYELAQLPDDVGPAAKAAATIWAPWAKTNGYRLDLDPSRRILLISSKSNVDAALGLVVKTIALFDSVCPPPLVQTPGDSRGSAGTGASKAGADSPGASGSSGTSGDVIPEDPETPPPGAPKTLPPGPVRTRVTEPQREARPFVADSETAVMLVVKNSTDYAAALDFIVAAHPYLVDWKPTALPQIGFALAEPLCGAYNETSPGQEEWNPDNELVHRTMALLVLRRFSAQPYWVHAGLCWFAEMGVMKSIYCMPYRDEFVGVGEHGGWLQALSSLYSGRAKDPLHMEELALKRGKWNDRVAKTALGMVDYLTKTNPRALSNMMEEMRRYAEQNGRQTNADGTWTKIRDYEIPGDQQKAILEHHFGVNVTRDVIVAWTSGGTEPAK